MRFYVGVTNPGWFKYLSNLQPEDVNFWQPGGKTPFKVLSAGAPFLFKLKSPYNLIAGVGFFSSQTFLPLSVAWDAFGNRNGCESFEDLRKVILNHRQDWYNSNPTIGCIVLTNPIFFKEEDWIPAPANWSNSIVQGKSYETSEFIGESVWQRIELLLPKYLSINETEVGKSQLLLEDEVSPRYREQVLSKVRLGQGAFRVLITDAYERRCSITGEKTLPVLEAAHIKPYAESGPHFISNGLLLRSDMHKLFDTGYLTITDDLSVEVSRRIKEEFQNGKEYYQFHGTKLKYLPTREMDRPDKLFIDWHNSNIFKS